MESRKTYYNDYSDPYNKNSAKYNPNEYPVDLNSKCCLNCIHFQDRTHFCRLNPPLPIVVYDKETRSEKVTSKFPVITMPQSDYCSGFEADGNK